MVRWWPVNALEVFKWALNTSVSLSSVDVVVLQWFQSELREEEATCNRVGCLRGTNRKNEKVVFQFQPSGSLSPIYLAAAALGRLKFYKAENRRRTQLSNSSMSQVHAWFW